MSVALSGNDTFILNNRSFSDFADGDFMLGTFPNNIADLKVGKNGNSIFSDNQTGNQMAIVLRLIKGSDDDKYMNTLMTQQKLSLATFILMAGSFIKNIGDGKGNITSDKYIISGGIFSKQVEPKSNAEGDTNQSVSEYNLVFAKGMRSLS